MFAWKIVFCSTIFVLLSIVTVQNAYNIEKHLIFRLYTREQPDHYQELKVDDLSAISPSSFNPNRPTRVFIHGFRGQEKVILRYKEAYLKLGDYNFIAVDWIRGASTYNYLKARNRIQAVSEKLGRLLAALVIKRGLNLQDVTIVGHSLGAHIAGRAAKFLQQLSRPIGRIACIIGLDPASFSFNLFKPEKRLTYTDADYVQVIHTDGSKFGMPFPIGDADFFPNGGRDQPGCPVKNRIMIWMDKCSHTRSHQLFLESLTINFTAIHCDTLNEVQKGYCTFDNVIGRMGGDITAETEPKPQGVFYLETRDGPPFFISDYHSYKKTVILDFGPDISTNSSPDNSPDNSPENSLENSGEYNPDFEDYSESFTSFYLGNRRI